MTDRQVSLLIYYFLAVMWGLFHSGIKRKIYPCSSPVHSVVYFAVNVLLFPVCIVVSTIKLYSGVYDFTFKYKRG